MKSPARLSSQRSRHTPCALLQVWVASRNERRDGTRSAPTTLRRGLSLMELLISTMLSIMVMGATVTLFGVVGERINGGRAMIETSDRVRAVENKLHFDLLGHTAAMLPWEQASSGAGYFEILKGPA